MSKKDPEFLPHVNKLNEGNSLKDALELSLNELDTLDVDLLKRIGLRT